MRTFLIILISLWTVFWIFTGVGIFIDTPGQIKRDKNYIAANIKPSVDFINKFNKDSSRLPTKREFYIWVNKYYQDNRGENIRYIRNNNDDLTEDKSIFKDADWKKDFAIGIWRGEWNEYFFSWNNTYESNNYLWKDSFVVLLLICGIGLLPQIFWIFDFKHRRKIVHNKS